MSIDNQAFAIKKTPRMLKIEEKFDEPLESLLKRWYVKEGKSTRAIGRKIGYGGMQIYNWLLKIGIPLRGSAEATKHPQKEQISLGKEFSSFYEDTLFTRSQIASFIGVAGLTAHNWGKGYSHIPLRKCNMIRDFLDVAKEAENKIREFKNSCSISEYPEKNLENEVLNHLRLQGIRVQVQVKCEAGIADIVTPIAIYELKHLLTRVELFKAVGQVLMYRQCINPDAQAIIVCNNCENNEFIPIVEKLGITVIVLENHSVLQNAQTSPKLNKSNAKVRDGKFEVDLKQRFKEFCRKTYLQRSQIASFLNVSRQTIHNWDFGNAYINPGNRDIVRDFLDIMNELENKLEAFWVKYNINGRLETAAMT